MTLAAASLRKSLPELASWVVPVAVAAAIGIVTLHAAGPVAPWLAGLWSKQLLWLVLGSAGAVLVAWIPSRWLRRAAFPAFGVLVVACLAASAMGPSYGGVRRWLSIGALSIQPAEFAKLALVVAMAHCAADLRDGAVRSAREHLVPALLLAGTIIPTLLQPYLGAALVAVLVFAGVALTLTWRWWIVAGGIGAAAAALPWIWIFGLHPYQKERVLSFVHPDRDPLGAGYQTHELILTVGSGRLTGQGAGSWAHAAPYPLRDVATEFPFAVWSHERGLLGAMIWLAAHAAIVLLAIRTSARAADRFGSTLAAGVAVLWLAHVLLSVGVSLGLLPVITVALPLGSYGGSNVVMSLLAVGLVAHVLVRSEHQRVALPSSAGIAST